MTEKLKPCPFCGCDDDQAICLAVKPRDNIYWGECDYCGGRGPERDDHDRAIAAWNRRAGDSDDQ